MKEYDRVKLKKDKKEYADAGIKKGDTGTILGEKRNGYWLVYFDGVIFKKNGVFQTNEIDVGVLKRI